MAETQSNHSFRYERGKLHVTGVSGVERYDDRSVEIRLNAGLLVIEGSGFVLEEMDLKTGLLTVAGALKVLGYRDKGEKMSLVKRIFR